MQCMLIISCIVISNTRLPNSKQLLKQLNLKVQANIEFNHYNSNYTRYDAQRAILSHYNSNYTRYDAQRTILRHLFITS